MRLFIAEKPSLARAIAHVLPPPYRRYRSHITCGQKNVVTWCLGHILQPAMPEEYDRKYKRWHMGDLPIVPGAWKLTVSGPALLSGIKLLLKGATLVVHAGDPDREGQLLVDEVLDFLGYDGPVDRLLVSDTNPEAVRRQLAAIEPNAKCRALGESALARQRADWLYGINMTRLYTLLGGAAGHRRILSVGRVQTPLLGLIARRDLAIESFHPAAFYALSATLRTAGGETVRAEWSPARHGAPDVDGEGRLVRKDVAEDIRRRAEGAEGRVASAEEERKTEGPPLPYSLADLQIDAARRLGLSAQDVLEACQALYETHRLTTYPRSDCAYLPEGRRADGKAVLAAVAAQLPAFAGLAAEADLSLRSRAWNNAKVTAHHAIIPTAAAAKGAALSATERAVYELVARRYLCQFFPPLEYVHTKAEFDVAGERFVAGSRRITSFGWRAASPGGGESDPTSLPRLRQGDVVAAAEVIVVGKQTEPPRAFTDASLMQAMVNIAAHVSDPEVKRILADADGIGTPATRPAIIETLFERGYIERKGKTIVSTPIGRALVASLPDIATTPDMTATWEAAMRAIAEGRQSLQTFLERTTAELRVLVAQCKAQSALAPPPPPPSKAAIGAERRRGRASAGGARR